MHEGTVWFGGENVTGELSFEDDEFWITTVGCRSVRVIKETITVSHFFPDFHKRQSEAE